MRFCAAIGASGSGTRQDTLQKRDLPRLVRTAPSAEKREEIAEMMRAASGIFWRGQKRLAPVLQTPNPSSSTQALRPQMAVCRTAAPRAPAAPKADVPRERRTARPAQVWGARARKCTDGQGSSRKFIVHRRGTFTGATRGRAQRATDGGRRASSPRHTSFSLQHVCGSSRVAKMSATEDVCAAAALLRSSGA